MKNKVSAIVLAAGKSLRFGEKKQLIKINNVPIYKYSLDVLDSFSNDIILVADKEDYEYIKNDVNKDINVIIGGDTRSMSSLIGLKQAKNDIVIIHDAARPLISVGLIKEMLLCLKNNKCVIASHKETNSVFNSKKNVYEERDNLLSIETPQIFYKDELLTSFSLIENKNMTDDLSVYLINHQISDVCFYENKNPNPKLTHKEDLKLVDSLMSLKKVKYGVSYDIHKFSDNRQMILGGINLDLPYGLLGHSDADVISHSITNAILGALSKKDIGHYFSDEDPQNKDIKSSKILKYIYNIMRKSGYSLINIDVMVILQKPKISVYIDLMIKHFSDLLKINKSQISIKATTNELIGLVGKNEGIASFCVAAIKGDK